MLPKKTTLGWIAIAITVLSARAGWAATFVVPPDELLVRQADAIVIGRAHGTRSEKDARGIVVTISSIVIAQVLKGDLASGDPIEVSELGGTVDGVTWVVPGSPQFDPAFDQLLFLSRTGARWQTLSMALGQFALRRSREGVLLAVRDAEVTGWDESGSVHRERGRDAARFLAYIRGVLASRPEPADYFVDAHDPLALRASLNASTAAPMSYTYISYDSELPGVTYGQRFKSYATPVVVSNRGTVQPGAVNGRVDALQQALTMWKNDIGSDVDFQYEAAPSGANLNVQFNDPDDIIVGKYPQNWLLGICVMAYGGHLGSYFHTYKGQRFANLSTGEYVIINDGLDVWAGMTNGGFVEVLAHELGHALGFRHSNEPGGTRTCADVPCSSDAIMTVPYSSPYASLQPWDLDAVRTVYETGVGTTLPVALVPTGTGSGRVTSQPAGIDCGHGSSACYASFPEGTVVTLTMQPDPASSFTGIEFDTMFPNCSGSTCTVTLTESVTVKPYFDVKPPFDECAGATVIDASSYTSSFTPIAATTSVTDPIPSCSVDRYKSVWYRFTSPADGTLTFDTAASSYPHVLAAYSGSCDALVPVPAACGIGGVVVAANVSFPVTKGSTYYAMIAATYDDWITSDTFHSSFAGSGPGLKGDANGDYALTVADVFYLINRLFASGPAPVFDCNVNGDLSTSAPDVFYLINYLYASGDPPV